MSLTQLKSDIIQKIRSIEDESVLESIELILNTKTVELTEPEKQMISAGEEDIKLGNVVSEEKLMYDAKKWLNSKKA